MSVRLRHALDLLESDRIKDRAEGLTTLRELLSSDKVIDNVTASSSWGPIFQKLFRCTVAERNAHLKKPSTTTENRLASAVQSVRWIVERGATRFPRKAVRPLLVHLLQTSIVRNKLFPLVSNEYIKALRKLLEYRPHLEHLDRQEWHESVVFCFAGVFGDDVKLQRDAIRDAEDRTEVDELDGSGSDAASPAAPHHKPLRAGHHEADLLACINKLFQSSAAPLIEYGNDLLGRFVRFFRLFPSETTAHVYAVGALDDLLTHLEYNAISAVTAQTPFLWTALLELWSTKVVSLRENIVIALRILWPFVLRQKEPQRLAHSMWTRLKQDVDVRWRVEDLRLDCVALERMGLSSEGSFRTLSFSLSPTASTSQQLAWLALQLSADGVAALLSDRRKPALVSPQRTKRRKVLDTLSEILADIDDIAAPTSLHRLQVLVFMIDRHWTALHEEIRVSISDHLGALLRRLDATYTKQQEWAFIAAARLAGLVAFEPAADGMPQSEGHVTWDSILQIAFRGISQAPTCRAACHTADWILAASVATRSTAVSLIQSLLKSDLLTMGPAMPYDSACALLTRCLEIAATDNHLFQLDLGAHVANWLGAHIGPETRTAISVPCLLSMCSLVAVGKQSPIASRSQMLHQGRLFQHAEHYREGQSLRRFIFEASMSAPNISESMGRYRQGMCANGRDTSVGLTSRLGIGLLNALTRALQSLTPEKTEADTADSWAALGTDRIRFTLDIAVTLIILHAIMKLASLDPPLTQLKFACQVVATVSAQLDASHRTPQDRWALFDAFEPLMLIRDQNDLNESLITLPGASSNVAWEILASLSNEGGKHSSDKHITLLSAVWGSDEAVKAFDSVRTVSFRLLAGEPHRIDDDPGSGDGAAFGEDADSSFRTEQRSDFELNLTLASILRFLMSMERYQTGYPARLAQVIAILPDVSTETALTAIDFIFKGIRDGHIKIPIVEARTLLEYIGGRLLPSYENGRNIHCQILGLEALRSSTSRWIPEDVDEYAINARKLCSWYAMTYSKQSMPSWQLRTHFGTFLDHILRLDPDQQAWDVEQKPSTILPMLLGDVDFRVRCRACVSLGRLFPLARHHGRGRSSGEAERTLFRTCAPYITQNVDDLEGMLTSILLLANVIVAASSQRVDPYIHLLGIASMSAEYEAYIAEVFAILSSRLGFRNRAHLHTYMAVPVAQRQMKLDTMQRHRPVSNLVSGFPSRQAAFECTFEAIGALRLACGDRAAFSALCKLVGRDVSAGATICFALAASYAISDTFERIGDDQQAIQECVVRLRTLAELCNPASGQTWEHMMINSADKIVAALIAGIWEEDATATGPYAAALSRASSTEDEEHLRIFCKLIEHRAVETLARPSTHSFSASAIRRALSWLESIASVTTHLPTIYHVANMLLVKANAAVFVHEQVGLLVNLCFFLANNVHRTSITRLWRLLLHGLTSLIRRSDLTQTCFSMFSHLMDLILSDADRGSMPALGDILVSAARIATEQIASARAQVQRERSSSHLDFLEQCVSRLLKDQNKSSGSLCAGAQMAAALWPRRLKQPVNLDLTQLQSILDSKLVSERFSLVSAFADQEQDWEGDELTDVLWRLLASVGATDSLSLTQCFAFCRLILKSNAKVSLPRISSHPARDMRAVVLESDLQAKIIELVTKLLAADDLSHVGTASQTLRLLFALSPGHNFNRLAGNGGLCNAEIMFFSSDRLQRPFEARLLENKRHFDEIYVQSGSRVGRNFASWIIYFANLLADIRFLDYPFYGQLAPLLADAAFCREVLPFLVHSMLIEEGEYPERPAAHRLSAYFDDLLNTESTDPEVVRCILDICSYLREQRQAGIQSPRSHDEWLPRLSWIKLSEAAVRCSMYTAALLYLELHQDYSKLESSDTTNTDVHLDNEARSILYSIYENIDEPDGFYGIPIGESVEAALRLYRHENRPFDALAMQGAQFETNWSSPLALHNVVRSTSEIGLNNLAFSILHSGRTSGALLDEYIPAELTLRMAWRSSIWSLPTVQMGSRASAGSIYSALRAVHCERDQAAIEDAVHRAVLTETGKLAAVSLNRPNPDANVLEALMVLQEVELWRTASQNNRSALLGLLSRFNEPINNDMPFYIAESMLLSRVSLIQTVREAETTDQEVIFESAAAQHACLMNLSKLARASARLQTSLNAVHAASTISVDDIRSAKCAAEFAHVLWAKGEHALAIESLTHVLKTVRHDGVRNPEHRGLECSYLSKIHVCSSTISPLRLSAQGTWSATSRLRGSQEILVDYFEPAEIIAEESPEKCSDVFLAFAEFADSTLRSNESHREEMRKLQAYQDRKQLELDSLSTSRSAGSARPHSGATASNTIAEQALRQARSRLELDRDRLSAFQHERKVALELTTRLYAKVLAVGDSSDNVVYRLVALWLENHADTEFNSHFKTHLESVPSRKFIVLAHQLSAKLSNVAGSAGQFRQNLDSLLARMTREHPFHVLYHMYSLRTAYGDTMPSQKSTSTASTRKPPVEDTATASQASRQKIASDFFAYAKAVQLLRARVLQLETVCAAYIDVALLGRMEPKKGSQKVDLSSQMKLLKLRDLSIPVSTFDLPVDPSTQYEPSTMPCIHKYERQAILMGGVNQPKVVTCVTHQKKRYRQLCKGGDDVRQDAVMEQVFGVVNHILALDESTRRRALRVRRYKVIPLIGSTGVLEFVDSTRTLGAVLDIVHKLYYPKDLDFKRARELVKSAADKPTSERVRVFKQVLAGIHPAMRHHFRDQRRLATPWFEMRLAFQRSIASNAIVGWMLGIGDRHVSNILFDDSTGEIVPIDFGVAFDAGELLPVPELVPFRMTQDIVDGLGLTGVNGVFRRCAEETLRVLREHSATIMSILEVLKFDPLQKWTLTAGKASRLQDHPSSDGVGRGPTSSETAEDVPADAARALTGVAAKLSTTLSVQQRVIELVRDATSHEHLATIFYGWQAYL